MVRFVVDGALLDRLAQLRGNVSALHRELIAEAGGRPVPSLATLHRAVQRALPGEHQPGTEQPRAGRQRRDPMRSTAPPDPGGATTVDDIAVRLRSLRGWAGEPSFTTITNRVNEAWTRAGRRGGELVGRTTVVDCFRAGRRHLNEDLVVAIVRVLHADPGYVAQWHQALLVAGGERLAAAQVRVHDELPPDLPTFTGRSGDLRRLRDALTADGPVLVGAIEGMAGAGKTRLAVRAAHLLHRERRFDRVLFVNLRGFHPDQAQPPADPAAVLEGFLRLLGVPGSKIPHDLLARARLYRQLLADVPALVVLDNAADADQVQPLLPGSPRCPVLVTSRRSLAALAPAVTVTLGEFSPLEAQRFLRSETGVPAAADDAVAAARIVELCGRLPLALGLVAAQIRARPGWNLADHADRLAERRRERRLDDGVDLALDLSYRHLDDERRMLLRRLSLHPGDEIDAYAAAALTGTDLADARAGMRQLYEDHLIQLAGRDRYTMHDLIRIHATVRAHDEERPVDRRAALTRLLTFYLAAAAAAMDVLHPGEAHLRPPVPPTGTATPALSDQDPDAARIWLDTERHNLVAIATHAADAGNVLQSVRLSAVLFRYFSGGYPAEALIVHGHTLDALRRFGVPEELPTAQAQAECGLGEAFVQLARHESAAEHLSRAVTLFEQAGDAGWAARALVGLAGVDRRLGRYAQAEAVLRQALALFERAGDRVGQARALTALGIVAERSGHFEATAYFEQALVLLRQAGDRNGEANALNSLGLAEQGAGRLEPAARHHAQALTLYRRLGDISGEAHALDNLGSAHLRSGRPAEAIDHHSRALALFRAIGEREGEAWASNGLGEAHFLAGRAAEARRHHQAALLTAIDIGDHHQQARARLGLSRSAASPGDRGSQLALP